MQVLTQKQKARYNAIARAAGKVKTERLAKKRHDADERKFLKQWGAYEAAH